MCGIAGIARSEAAAPSEDVDAVRRMTSAMGHRGPDDEGIYDDPTGRCVLGNRRLAVIDLSPAGHMPMAGEGDRFWITYNGEIYNFRELRRELEAKGHRFRSGTDTEVVLRLYEEYGQACVERLNGMFAFAIWDQQEGELFLARDRFGIKPLYYAQKGDSLVFASELRTILASGQVAARADLTALSGYLTLGSVPDDRTAIEGVRSLPPAHCALFADTKLQLRRYWSHSDDLRRVPTLRAEEAVEALREGLCAAVRRQVVSDAPLGLFLSGGMDSTALAALMRAAGVESIRSVSVRFEEEEYDEGEAARDVARRFGLEHTEIRVGSDEVLTALDRVIDSMDQPTVDGINTYFVSRAAREAGLTVALSGLGADELFGGYPTFQSVPRTQRIMRDLRRLPGHRALLPLAVRAPGMPRSARKLVTWTNGTSSLPAAYAAVRGLLAPDEVRALGGEEVFDPGRYVDLSVDLHGLEPAVAVSALESRIYMHNQLLRDTDAMSMANSLEVRVPFLDQEVVELAARSRSLLGRPRKPALSAARAIYFPLAGEPKTKRSFTFPLDRWLRGPFGRQLEAETSPVVLSSQGLHGLFEEVRAGRRHWSQVWAPVVLSRWLEARGVTA